MRLEQLVLFGPSDNFCFQFGPRVTVMAGLADAERASMITTLVDAMAGKVPNASVIFVDQAGRRVFADRTGATYADSGVAAPSLSELLGSDPKVIADLVTLRAEDLGLGEHRTEESIAEDAAQAKALVDQLHAEHTEATTFVVHVDGLKAELAALDERIARAPDEVAHWNWTLLRNQLDELRAELASLDREDEGEDHHAADTRLLAAVEELRSAGETWAEASTEATELAGELGPLPPVSDSDLARVAATPESLPDDLDRRLAAVDAAAEVRVAREIELAAALAPAEDPGDLIVFELAKVDQEQLWETHARAIRAHQNYEAELAARKGDLDSEVETRIEETHHEVVRRQRELEVRFRPGILGSAAFAMAALLAGESVSVLIGLPLLAACIAMAFWLLVIPRRALAAAVADEEAALAHTEAGSWLGLHLRRIDDVMQPTDRTSLSAAIDMLASSRLDWEELVGRTTIESVTERADAIRAFHDASDPKIQEAREAAAIAALTSAKADEALARRDLAEVLGAFGLTEDAIAELSPTQVAEVLRQRTAAGSFARRAMELHHHTATATSAGAILDRLLRDLGFTDGDLAGRLERAIVSVEAARRRRMDVSELPVRSELEAEIERISAEVEHGRRLSWDLLPAPTEAPGNLAELMDRRRALAEELDSIRVPDLADVERRASVAAERVRMLEAELATITDGPAALRRRLADRIARTTWVGPQEEALPLLIDDALLGVDPEELFKLLDMVVRLSSRTQIVLLSSDATVAKWARREAAHGIITVFETDGAAVL